MEVKLEETATSRLDAQYQAELEEACKAVTSEDGDAYRTILETCEKFIWKGYVEEHMSPCDLSKCHEEETGRVKHCCEFCNVLRLSAEPSNFEDANIHSEGSIHEAARALAEALFGVYGQLRAPTRMECN